MSTAVKTAGKWSRVMAGEYQYTAEGKTLASIGYHRGTWDVWIFPFPVDPQHCARRLKDAKVEAEKMLGLTADAPGVPATSSPSSTCPSEVDRQLASLYTQQAIANDSRLRAQKKVLHLREASSVADGLRLAREAASAQEIIKAARAEHLRLHDLLAPLEAEHDRDPWPRYWLAKSSDGHVHGSDRCQTLHRNGVRTPLLWQTHRSGRPAQEVVEEIGENACTVCFPWAETAIREARQKATADKQAVRQQKAAARQAAEATKKITHPDGSVLKNHIGDVLGTEREALAEAVDNLARIHSDRFLADLITRDPDLDGVLAASTGDFADRMRRIARQRIEATERILTALAAKRGDTVESLRAELDAKAMARAKRERRDQFDLLYRFALGTDEWKAYQGTKKAKGQEPWHPRKKGN